MAEICFECLNKVLGENAPRCKYIISKDLDLCEECGRIKHVVEVERFAYYKNLFKPFWIPFRVLFFPVEFIARVVLAIIRSVGNRSR